jgi:hypothetical protein
MLIEKRVDYTPPGNLVLTALVLGLSGTAVKFGAIALKGAWHWPRWRPVP